jgi:hypothetical protein
MALMKSSFSIERPSELVFSPTLCNPFLIDRAWFVDQAGQVSRGERFLDPYARMQTPTIMP